MKRSFKDSKDPPEVECEEKQNKLKFTEERNENIKKRGVGGRGMMDAGKKRRKRIVECD